MCIIYMCVYTICLCVCMCRCTGMMYTCICMTIIMYLYDNYRYIILYILFKIMNTIDRNLRTNKLDDNYLKGMLCPQEGAFTMILSW